MSSSARRKAGPRPYPPSPPTQPNRILGPVAAGRLVDPALRQVEPHVDRRVLCSIGQHREHRHLTIVDLAQPPAPLSGNANRAIPLLDETALVDDQRAVRLAAQQAVGITAD